MLEKDIMILCNIYFVLFQSTAHGEYPPSVEDQSNPSPSLRQEPITSFAWTNHFFACTNYFLRWTYHFFFLYQLLPSPELITSFALIQGNIYHAKNFGLGGIAAWEKEVFFINKIVGEKWT